MKIIFLNAYHGNIFEPIKQFIQTHAADTDIFCFQEAYEDVMRPLCRELLPGFQEFTHDKEKVGDDFGQATYVRNDIHVISSGPLLDNAPECGVALYIKVAVADQNLYICNFHGVPMPGEKFDTPPRLQQSKELIKFFENHNAPAIIGGDFNLMPETESVKIFETRGYKNLIQDYNISTTRNQISWAKYPDSRQYYADFVFTPPEVAITQFHVPQNQVSDHLPMIIEFDILKSNTLTKHSVATENSKNRKKPTFSRGLANLP